MVRPIASPGGPHFAKRRGQAENARARADRDPGADGCERAGDADAEDAIGELWSRAARCPAHRSDVGHAGAWRAPCR